MVMQEEYAELSNYSSVLRCENTNQAQVQGAKYAGGILWVFFRLFYYKRM